LVNLRFAFILAAAMLAACGGHPVRQINVLHEAHNAMSQDALTVNMGAIGNSRQWGSASIGDARHGVDVQLELQNSPRGASEAAYIARSNCTPPVKTAWRRLHPVVGGKSATYLPGIDIGVIKKGRYSIVVESANAKTAVACGNFQI
jgi:hypothetical protein